MGNASMYPPLLHLLYLLYLLYLHSSYPFYNLHHAPTLSGVEPYVIKELAPDGRR